MSEVHTGRCVSGKIRRENGDAAALGALAEASLREKETTMGTRTKRSKSAKVDGRNQ